MMNMVSVYLFTQSTDIAPPLMERREQSLVALREELLQLGDLRVSPSPNDADPSRNLNLPAPTGTDRARRGAIGTHAITPHPHRPRVAPPTSSTSCARMARRRAGNGGQHRVDGSTSARRFTRSRYIV